MWWIFNQVRAVQDWSAEQVMDRFFQGPELKALYTAILADFVVRPSQFRGLGIPTVNVETAFDKPIPRQVSKAGPRSVYHYVLGGCGQMVEAMAGAIRRGGGADSGKCTGAPDWGGGWSGDGRGAGGWPL
jgi:phytoene dehydrogenase-like protein